MKRLTARLMSMLLIGAVCTSVFGGCSTQGLNDPVSDLDETPPLLYPQEQAGTQPDDIPKEPDTGEETPNIPQEPEPATPSEEPDEDPDQPQDPVTEPSENIPPEEGDEKELPRDVYDLPYPIVTLTEDEAKLCLAQTEEVSHEYFTDAVFLGDSVTLGLRNYATKKRKSDPDSLSNATCIGVGSYGVYEALRSPSEKTSHSL